METKICKDCNIPKVLSLYSLKVQSYKGIKKHRLRGSCKDCYNKQRRIATKKLRAKSEFKIQNKLDQNKYWHTKGKITKYKWKKNNKDKICTYAKIAREKEKTALTDNYIKRVLINSLKKTTACKGLSFKQSDIPLEMIAIQRRKMLLTKKLNHEKTINQSH